MIRFIKRLWSSAPFAVLVLAASLIVAGVFAARSIAFWAYWNDPAHRAQAIEPWMTPKYISHSWRVPPDIVIDAMGPFEHVKKGPMSLEHIATTQDVDPQVIVNAIQDAIQDFTDERQNATSKLKPSKRLPQGVK